jgi:hypothetical protein
MARIQTAPPLAPGSIPDNSLAQHLQAYKDKNGTSNKGQIAAIIFASRLARRVGLPIDIEKGITTDGEGQVKGLGKAAVQQVLADYKITRVLAEEGGRTSRGSLGNIRNFLGFLNDLHAQGLADTAAIEAWWVDQAKAFFNAKPFALRFESGKALRSVVRDLLSQAKKRQDESGGTMFVGAMLQHLVGAKLELALPNEYIVHHGFSVADAPGGRSGDFEIGNASLHVTTMPGEAVIRKCVANLHAGRHPVVITLHDMLPAADAFATAQGIADKLDVLDAEQFIVANLHELGEFKSSERRVTVEALVDKYNAIITHHETDPSLKISRD